MPYKYDLPHSAKEMEIGKTRIIFADDAYVNGSKWDFDEVLKSIVKSVQQCCTADMAPAAATEELDLPAP